MKLKYIFTALVAALTLAVGCEDDIERYLDEVKVSSSYVAIPAAGGSQTITVNASADWSFGDIPEWLTVSPTSGAAGETTVSFKADAATSTNETMFYLTCDGKSQIINVLQQTEKVEPQVIPLKEFLAKEVSPTVYRIAGTISNIQEISASYKNATLTISDDEGYSVYCYRFGPPSGKKIEDLGMEVGDFLTVEGARGEYNGSPQMAQGGVFVSLVKSLIKVDSVSVKEPLPVEGGEFKAYLTCKGEGVSVVVPDDAKSWLSVTSIETSGTNATVTFIAADNQLGDRATNLTFNTTSNGKVYSAQTSLEQKGSILAVTVGEFLKAAVSPAQYRLTGTVKKISVSEQYNNADITVADALGNSVLVHRMKPASGKITDLTIGVGDKLTVLGQRGEYNGTAQMVNGVYESHVHYIPATIKEFLAKEVSDVEYIVTGKIVNIKEISASFKNATLTIADDEGTTLYVFRMKAAEGGPAIENIGLKVGDVLTVIGKRGEFNGSAQMVNGYYVSHEAGSVEPEPEYVKIWSEDWSSYKAEDKPTDPYTCTGSTKIYEESLAGGKSPEILVGKNKGTLAIKISDLKGMSGDLRFSYKCNKDFLTVSCSDNVKVTEKTKGKEFILSVLSGVKAFTITITNPNSQNARVDDLLLEGTK